MDKIQKNKYYTLSELQRINKVFAGYSIMWLHKLIKSGQLKAEDVSGKRSKYGRWIVNGSDALEFAKLREKMGVIHNRS